MGWILQPRCALRLVLLCSLGVGACIWIFDGVAVLAVKPLIGLFTH